MGLHGVVACLSRKISEGIVTPIGRQSFHEAIMSRNTIRTGSGGKTSMSTKTKYGKTTVTSTTRKSGKRSSTISTRVGNTTYSRRFK